MENTNKIIKQIERLCEKQFRKGFQQGYYASENKELTSKDVDEFRYKGNKERYSKVIQPHTGIKEDAKYRLIAECDMRDMEELKQLLSGK